MNTKLLSFLFGNLGVFSIRFLYFIILTFILNLKEIAEFTTCISISGILLCICNYGNYNLFMRRSSKGEDSKKILGEYIFTSIILLFLFSVIFYIYSQYKQYFLGVRTENLLLILISEYFFSAVPGIFKAYALSEYNQKILLDSITNIITSLLLLICSSLLWYFYYTSNSYVYSYWINMYLLIGVISFIIRILIWKKNIVLPSIKQIIPNLFIQLKSGNNFMFSSVFRNFYLNIDKILILNLLGKEVAGYYAISFRFFNVLLMILNSISGVKEAKLYQLYEESFLKFKSEIKAINNLSLKYFIFSIPLWIVVAISIYYFYPLSCLYIFIMLMLICPIQLLSFTMLNALNSIGLENQRLSLMIFSVLINCIISFSLSTYISWGAIVIGILISNIIIVASSKYYIYTYEYKNF
ncbi:oligosaccharide flippase family protein [Proteus mirabilis]